MQAALCTIMINLLVTRPNHDETTDALAQWAGQIIKLAKEKQLTVLDLFSNKATRKMFLSYLHKHPILIFLNGHGNSDVIMGQNNEPLLSATDEIRELVKSVLYARSCEAGRILGPTLITKGLRTFIGYKRKFFFFRSSDHTTHPLKDPYAKQFLEPSNRVVSTLLKGHSVVEAYQRSQTEMRRNFQKMLISSESFESRLMAPYLWSNITSQIIIGDKEARISS